MLNTAATDGGDKILSHFSALYTQPAELQETEKEYLESMCFACLQNVKLEQLEMWSVRIKAAAYICLCIYAYMYMQHMHRHAALNKQEIFAIWRSHR